MRFVVFCYVDGSERQCHLTGKMKYRHIWIGRGDLVLIKRRNYQDHKADIVYKYTQSDYQLLLKLGELTECNPRKLLSTDIISLILNYLDYESQQNFISVLNLPQELILKINDTKKSPVSKDIDTGNTSKCDCYCDSDSYSTSGEAEEEKTVEEELLSGKNNYFWT